MSHRLILFCLFCISLTIFVACKDTPCEDVNCQNGGSCIELSGNCECPGGYEGRLCDTLSRQKFLGQYNPLYEGCFDTSPNHQLIIDQDPVEPDQILIYDLGDYACPAGEGRIILSASVDTTRFEIPEQSIDCGSIVYTFSGQGSKSGNIITITFTNSYDADGIAREDQCIVKLEN